MAELRFRSPALVPAAAALAGVAIARGLPLPVPVGAGALLLILGIALGGSRARGVVALAFGSLCGVVDRAGAALPFTDPARIVLAAGRICGHPQRYPEGGASVTLCAERLRRGAEVATGDWRIRLDLAPRVVPPALGTRVRARGSLARTAGYDNADRSPPGRWALRVKSAPFLEIEREAPAPLAAIAEVRRRLDRAWRSRPAAASDRATSLARALVLGDAQALPRRWQGALRRTGLAHLIAVSGFNVALVAGAALLASAALPRPLALVHGVAAAGGYLALVGPEPSLVRATAMAGAGAAALLARRAPTPLHALSWIAAAMALDDPEVLDSAGFRLSVAATAGLLGLSSRLSRSLPERPGWLCHALAASLAAQIAATPFAVDAFGRLPLAAPLLNLVMVPAAALGLIAGLLAGVLEVGFGAAAGQIPRPLLEIAALPFEALAHLPPSPLWSLAVPQSLGCGLALAGGLWAATVSRAFRRAALLALLLAGWSEHGRPQRESIELTLFDVGQGESILLRGAGATLLVDGGGARGRDLAAAVLVPALARRGVHRLDAIVLSHGDRDHCGGLADLLGWLPIREVWRPVGLADGPCPDELAGAAPVRTLRRGDRLRLASFDIEVLHPEPTRPRRGNAVSLVLAVQAAGRRVLLTGDLDGAGERLIAASLAPQSRFDLLKLSHHGSASSTTPELLDRLRPRLALVSAGPRSPYGHPATATLARLASRGVPVLRTDRDGEVSIRWRDGEPLAIRLPGSPRRHLARDQPLD